MTTATQRQTELLNFIVAMFGFVIPTYNPTKSCTDLRPHHLLDLAFTTRRDLLPKGVSLVYDVNGDVHAYKMTSASASISLPAETVFSKCQHFPGEYSIFINIKYETEPKSWIEECLFSIYSEAPDEKNDFKLEEIFTNENRMNKPRLRYKPTRKFSPYSTNKNSIILNIPKISDLYRTKPIINAKRLKNQRLPSRLLLKISVYRRKLLFKLKNARVRLSTFSIFDGRWHRLVFSVTGNSVVLTVDCRMRQHKLILGRDVHSRLDVSASRLYLASCPRVPENDAVTFYPSSALIKDIIFLPEVDAAVSSCPSIDRYLKSHISRTIIKVTTFSESHSRSITSVRAADTCKWTDVGYVAYDIYSGNIRVCVNGVWQDMPTVTDDKKRLDYLTQHQDIRTPAPSIDVEVFNIPGEGLFAAFSNSATNKRSLLSQSIIVKWQGAVFRHYQFIASLVTQCIKFFHIGSQYFLAVANYGYDASSSAKSVIYRWDRKRRKFWHFQEIATWTARDFEYFKIDRGHYLVVANYAKFGRTAADSVIYKWNRKVRRFEDYQYIATTGAYDWTYQRVGDHSLLAVANAFDGRTTKVFSTIYLWKAGRFVQYQTVETNGATDFEFFTIVDDLYVVVANAYNYGPQNFRGIHSYRTNSTIYKLDKLRRQFFFYQSIVTYSAIDWEHFQVGKEHYIVVSNSQNELTDSGTSVIYRYQGSEGFVAKKYLKTPPTADWEVFSVNSNAYLIFANAKGTSSHVLKFVYV